MSPAPKPKRTSISPVTLRLTPDERTKLEELAQGMTLSAYIRACLFAQEEQRRKRRPKSVVNDKKAVAEALALLGQSRIANNLNQLAYHANIGALEMDEADRADMVEVYDHVLSIRSLLMQALGKSPARSGPVEASSTATRSARRRDVSSISSQFQKHST